MNTTLTAHHLMPMDTWTYEAWRLILIAAELGVTLDYKALAHYDVYNLRTLQRQARRALVHQQNAHSSYLTRLLATFATRWHPDRNRSFAALLDEQRSL